MSRDKFLDRFQKIPVDVYQHRTHAEPLVSVCVQTYQHVNFIKDCLDGILMQKTDFFFEILLGEDASTDGTREVCKNYAEKNPDKIGLFLHHRENNIKINNMPTGRFNIMYNLFNARGKYIAICEGDDYWIDPYKLQKQVDFLEANPSFSMCFHNALIMEDDKLTKKNILPPLDKSVFDTEDTLYPFRSFAPTASIVLRNNFLTQYFDWFYSCVLGDRIIFTMSSKHGKIKYLDFFGSVRRIHQGGISSNFTQLSDALNRNIFFKNIPKYIGREYKPLCDRYLKYFYELSIQYYIRNQSSNCSYPISILKGLRYLLSPTYLSLLKVTSIKDDKGFINLAYYMLRIIISKLKRKYISLRGAKEKL